MTTTMQWVLLLPFSLLTKPFGLVTYPFVALFCNKDGWLPICFYLWQTPDNSMDGDLGFRTEHAPFKGRLSPLKRYVNRVAWGYRNSMYGFKIHVLGFHLPERFESYCEGSNFKTSDRPPSEGWVKRVAVTPDDRKVFQVCAFYRIYRDYYFDFMTGWKLWEKPSTGFKQYAFRLRVVKRDVRGYNDDK